LEPEHEPASVPSLQIFWLAQDSPCTINPCGHPHRLARPRSNPASQKRGCDCEHAPSGVPSLHDAMDAPQSEGQEAEVSPFVQMPSPQKNGTPQSEGQDSWVSPLSHNPFPHEAAGWLAETVAVPQETLAPSGPTSALAMKVPAYG
jgi:hypothetical protein